MYLMEKIKQMIDDKQFVELKSNYSDFINQQENEKKTNVKVDKDNFNLKIFNQIYNDTRLNDVYDDGYGDMIGKKIDRERKYYDPNDIEIENVFSDKFNISVFNTVFNSMKENQDQSDNMEIIEYSDPSAIISENSCAMLGQDKIKDFSCDAFNNNLQYTDYKKAHTNGTLINPNKVKQRGDFKNMEELEEHRSNINYHMSPEEIARQEYLKSQENEAELKRLERVKEYDNRGSIQYNRVNQQLLDRF